jgi:hypothetical protein
MAASELEVPVSFDALIKSLQAHWAKVSAAFADVDEILVIGIDLGKRDVKSKRVDA